MRPGSAARKKDSYLRAQFHRIKSRRGPKKAAVALAASLLTIASHLLRDGTQYTDLGPAYFDTRWTAARRQAPSRLADLGVEVEVKTAA